MHEIESAKAYFSTKISKVNQELILEFRRLFLESTEKAKNIQTGQSILQSLYFGFMHAREFAIPRAHSKTFQWVFDSQDIYFADWLKQSSGIYWIAGKPGSGKSTLMKFLARNATTIALLEGWAIPAKLVTASYYFWSPGSEMQKSQKGLLQHLLYQILKNCPDLIPQLCPGQWNAGGPPILTECWSLDELQEAFRLLSNVDMETRFCFFIDGLDEYNGDPFSLIQIIRELALHPNFKICVSSRPWPCFKDAFGLDPRTRLYVQDLTREDIKRYAEDHLPVQHLRRDVEKRLEIVQEVVDRAQGVFLWVVLVIRSLREGLSNGDSMTILKERLLQLPTDLEQFFELIINSVNQVYHCRMAHAFRIALAAREPLHPLIYSFVDGEFEDPENAEYALNEPTDFLSSTEIDERREDIERQLSGRYKGLLELSSSGMSRNWTVERVLTFSLGAPIRPPGAEKSLQRVNFLHRTVRDFLLTNKISDKLQAKSHSQFSPPSSICQALLYFAKVYPEVISNYMFDDFAFYACLFGDNLESIQVKVITAFGKLFNTRKWPLPKTTLKGLDEDGQFLICAIKHNFSGYVKVLLGEDSSFSIRDRSSCLMVALSESWNSGANLLAVVRTLLDAGANPNQNCGRSTIFGWYLMDQMRNRIKSQSWREPLKLMLDHGADGNHLHSATRTIFKAFLDFCPFANSNHPISMDTWVSHLELFPKGSINVRQIVDGSPCWLDRCITALQETPSQGQICVTVFEIFLSHGLESGWSFHTSTIFGELLSGLLKAPKILSGFKAGGEATARSQEVIRHRSEIIRLFLQHGADPYTIVPDMYVDEPKQQDACQVIKKFVELCEEEEKDTLASAIQLACLASGASSSRKRKKKSAPSKKNTRRKVSS